MLTMNNKYVTARGNVWTNVRKGTNNIEFLDLELFWDSPVVKEIMLKDFNT